MIPLPYEDVNRRPGIRVGVIGLIVLNVLCLKASRSDEIVRQYGLYMAAPKAHQWITSLFLHAGFFHLLGNMWFLWLFGCNVEYAMGDWFIPFYLLSGVAAGYGQVHLDPGRAGICLGASGAVSAVVGAYLVLYPRARLKCILYIPPLMRVYYSLSALLFGFMFFAWQYYASQVLYAVSNIAYGAHLAGGAFGVAVGLLMKATLPEPSQSLSGAAGEAPEPPSPGDLTPIEQALDSGDDASALQGYVELVRRNPYTLLSERHQIMIAEKLATTGWPHLAKDALERLILRYPRHIAAAEGENWLAWVEQQFMGDYGEAEKAYRRAMLHPAATPELKKEAGDRLAKLKGFMESAAAAPAGDDGPCRILLEIGLPLSTHQERRILSALEQAGDLEEQVSFDSGTLLRGVPRLLAARAAYALLRADIPVAVVPESRIIPLPEFQPCTRIDAEPDDLLVFTGPEEPERLAWKDCLLIAGAGLVQKESRPAQMPTIASVSIDEVKYGRQSLTPGAEAPEPEEVQDARPLIEIVSLNPLARFRWVLDRDPYFEVMGKIVLASLNVPINAGAQAALSKKMPPAMVFKDANALDAYIDCQSQLAGLRVEGACKVWADS